MNIRFKAAGGTKEAKGAEPAKKVGLSEGKGKPARSQSEDEDLYATIDETSGALSESTDPLSPPLSGEIPILIYELQENAQNCIAGEDYRKAIIFYDKAYHILQTLNVEQSSKDKHLMLITTHNLALCYQKYVARIERRKIGGTGPVRGLPGGDLATFQEGLRHRRKRGRPPPPS